MVGDVVAELGMQPCRYKDGWSLFWGDTWDAVSTVTPKRFQKINHFPGMTSICRKDLLGKNLSRLARQFPNECVARLHVSCKAPIMRGTVRWKARSGLAPYHELSAVVWKTGGGLGAGSVTWFGAATAGVQSKCPV